MELPAILGFAGDSINFVAAILLVWDPRRREQVYLTVQADKTLPPEVEFLDYKGNAVPRGENLEKILVRGESIRSRVAYVMLIVGFALLIAARGLEARRAAQHEPPANPPCIASPAGG